MTGKRSALHPPTHPLVSNAQTVRVIAARHSAAADATRKLHGEVAEALIDAGFGQPFVPKRWGGEAATFAEVTEAVATVGEGCASAAWIGSLLAYTARFAAFLPEEGQAEVWEKGPSASLVSSLVSAATAEAADGGWRLSGSWQYVSGVEFSDWALLMAQVVTKEGKQARFFAVPRDRFTIVDSWFTVGMRATGSHTVLVDDVFVPSHRSFLMDDMFAGRNAVSGEPCHSLPLFAVNGLTFSAPILGAVRGALKLSRASLASAAGKGGGRPQGSEAREIDHARSAGEIDAAALLLERLASVVDSGQVTGELVLRGSRDAALAVETLVGAADRLFRNSGTRGQSEAEPMQRVWRDVHAASSHMVLQFQPAAIAFTKASLAEAQD